MAPDLLDLLQRSEMAPHPPTITPSPSASFSSAPWSGLQGENSVSRFAATRFHRIPTLPHCLLECLRDLLSSLETHAAWQTMEVDVRFLVQLLHENLDGRPLGKESEVVEYLADFSFLWRQLRHRLFPEAQAAVLRSSVLAKGTNVEMDATAAVDGKVRVAVEVKRPAVYHHHLPEIDTMMTSPIARWPAGRIEAPTSIVAKMSMWLGQTGTPFGISHCGTHWTLFHQWSAGGQRHLAIADSIALTDCDVPYTAIMIMLTVPNVSLFELPRLVALRVEANATVDQAVDVVSGEADLAGSGTGIDRTDGLVTRSKSASNRKGPADASYDHTVSVEDAEMLVLTFGRLGTGADPMVVKHRHAAGDVGLAPRRKSRTGTAATLEAVELLGVGLSGYAYACKDALQRRSLVVKIALPGHEDELRREVDVYRGALRPLQGSAVPELLGVFSDHDIFCLVLSHQGTSLRSCGFKSLSGRTRTRVFGLLQRIHEHGVEHGDFCPENVVMASDGRCTIIDFATAQLQHVCPGVQDCDELRRARSLLGI